MKKRKVGFRCPEHIIDRVVDFKKRKGLEDLTTTYTFILDDYFKLIEAAKKEPGDSLGNGFFKSVVEDLDLLKRENRELKKMLLIIGAKDLETKDELIKQFPQYYKKTD